MLGVSIIYYLTGSTHYDSISTCVTLLLSQEEEPRLLIFAIMLILFTLLFKLSAAPFYHWAPDLYDGLNTNISVWMMVLPKITVFSLLYFLKDFILIPGYTDAALALSGTLSLIIGSGALTQQWNIKRFFAFSSISHIGFILLALSSKEPNSYFIYLFVYIITTVNIFSILIILSQHQGRDIKFISQLMGLYHLNPFLSFALALNLLSLSGRCASSIFYF